MVVTPQHNTTRMPRFSSRINSQILKSSETLQMGFYDVEFVVRLKFVI